ncbi:TetR/AcrR family transcriptional regulator [Paenibacillus sp. GCM10023250]|uniref:TetR/AcrR family transcriptional regulator n=1 Tax=Paenibacillus sp. GCM10023250 TaxID=3252648 RepID=UPI003612EFFF
MNNEQDVLATGERRRTFLEIALRLFAKHGYHSTKISDIVAEAGVAQGTFYWHFKSKEAIALEIVADGRARLLEVIAQGYRREPGTVADMVQASEALLVRLFRFAADHRYFMELLLQGGASTEPIRKALSETRAALEHAFHQNIQRAVELGMLPSAIDTEMRAALLTGLIEGVISRWLPGVGLSNNGMVSKTAEQLAHETVQFEFFGLLGS